MSSDPLPADLAAAHAMILAQREQLTLAKSEVTVGRLEIERLKLMLAKARREQFGQSSERGRLLVEQLELAIEDLEETQAEQETKAEITAPEAAKQKRAQNPRPPRRPLPDNLPVERIVEPAPCACGKCGSERLHKLGEVISKTLECEPRRWKIIEHVREKFSCCVSAWNKGPVFGVIGIQSGPPGRGSTVASIESWKPRLGCWWWRRLRRSVAPILFMVSR